MIKRINTFVFLILLLVFPLLIACSALPDSAKSNQTIADEIWDCLDTEEREGALLFGGKTGMTTLLAETYTKDELIAMREDECSEN